MNGRLWRDVVNFLGSEPVTPGLYFPLIEMVAETHQDGSYFLGRLPKHLTDASDREDIERGLAYSKIAYRLWMEERDGIARWAAQAEGKPVSMDRLRDWWLDGERDFLVAETERAKRFFQLVKLTAEEEPVIGADLADKKTRRILLRRLRHDLEWIGELELLRTLARKSWPPDPSDREEWTRDEFVFVASWYEDQQPVLIDEDGEHPTVDPFTVEPILDEQSLGIGLDGLPYCRYVITRATVIDFMDEILATSRLPRARGSLRCIECNTFVGRRALGYGQLYCGEVCKKRAAKRRYRARRRTIAEGGARARAAGSGQASRRDRRTPGVRIPRLPQGAASTPRQALLELLDASRPMQVSVDPGFGGSQNA